MYWNGQRTVSSADASVQSPEKVALGFITPPCVFRAPLKGFATPQRSDSIRDLLAEEDCSDVNSLFGGDDTDEDPDFILEDKDKSDEEDADDAVPEPNTEEGAGSTQPTGPGLLRASVPLQRIRHVNAHFGKMGVCGVLLNQKEEAVLRQEI
ncbi:hypothetical protein J6590_049321 [Homalodisca vitripennis]|nr:hypothetical protein J6590_049321 [Homalodisca vitripennis]